MELVNFNLFIFVCFGKDIFTMLELVCLGIGIS